MTPSRPPLLLHVFPSFAVGGAQARFATLANAFADRYRHAVVGMDGRLDCRARLSGSLDVAFPEPVVRKGDAAGNLHRFAALLRTLRPDVLITSNWGSIEWAMANLFVGRPHLHMEDGFGPEERDRQLPRRVWARRLLLRRSVVMLPSQTLRRIAGDIWKLRSGNLRYIPNGVDLGLFAPSAPGPRWRGGHPVIGTVAALRPEKNIARLIRAFALLGRDHGARLVIVGDGPERAALESLARALSLSRDITFCGHIDAPQTCYAGFDVFALSSDTEQMPLSVLEAMAAGLPVAAADVGDVRTMLSEENRAHITPCDDAALAAALSALLADPAYAHRIGAANRLRAERSFALQHMIASHGALIEAVRTRTVRSADEPADELPGFPDQQPGGG